LWFVWKKGQFHRRGIKAIKIRLPHNWSPREYQRPLWNYLSRGGRYAVECAHRRWGKDEVTLHHTACAAHERPGNYAHMLPEYSQARKAIWNATNPHTGKKRIDEAFPQELRAYTREQEMIIGFHNNATWQVVGSDNYDSLMGTSFAGMVMSEYALGNPSAWGYFAPILMENNGWAVFISTPRGKNHFHSMMKTAKRQEDWFWEISTAKETGVFTEKQLAEELERLTDLHGADFGRALWEQEYFCSFEAAILGSIWGDCLDKAKREGRIGEVLPIPGHKVYTAWDLGFTDDTAIWFYQIIGRKIRIFDYYQSTGKGIPEYAQILRDKAKEGNFSYGDHWLPHDARARTVASGGESIQQQMIKEDVGRIVIAKRLDHQDGIQAARATFPFCEFDDVKCAYGLEVLRGYHREWDDEKKVFTNRPVHDWASHGSSAFRTLALSWRPPKTQQPEEPIYPLAENSETKQTFGHFKKQHLQRMRRLRQ